MRYCVLKPNSYKTPNANTKHTHAADLNMKKTEENDEEVMPEVEEEIRERENPRFMSPVLGPRN